MPRIIREVTYKWEEGIKPLRVNGDILMMLRYPNFVMNKGMNRKEAEELDKIYYEVAVGANAGESKDIVLGGFDEEENEADKS